MLRSPRALAVLALLAPLTLGACDESDAVSVHLRLRADFQGTITTSGLVAAAGPNRVESASTGAAFDDRAEVAAASGRFAALNGLKVGDIAFAAGEADEGFRFIKVTLPQGAAAQWPNLFVPLDEAARLKAAGALDPSGKSKDVGTSLKIEIELPGAVIGNGVQGKVRGTKFTSEGAIATLIVPVQAARGATEPLVWHLTWQK
jgi:hypothetical protein